MFDYIACEMPLPRLESLESKEGEKLIVLPHAGKAELSRLESKEGEKLVVHIPYKADHQYQTKDLDNALVEYKIGKDRVLYEKNVEYEKRKLTEEEKKDKESGGFWHPMWYLEPISEEWVKHEYTGYINFYDFITDIDESNDAWVEYRAHVKDGEIQEGIELVKFDIEDNSERKESTERLKVEMKARSEYRKKWRYRFFGQYWNALISCIFRTGRRVGSTLNNTFKIEDKLKF